MGCRTAGGDLLDCLPTLLLYRRILTSRSLGTNAEISIVPTTSPSCSGLVSQAAELAREFSSFGGGGGATVPSSNLRVVAATVQLPQRHTSDRSELRGSHCSYCKRQTTCAGCTWLSYRTDRSETRPRNFFAAKDGQHDSHPSLASTAAQDTPPQVSQPFLEPRSVSGRRDPRRRRKSSNSTVSPRRRTAADSKLFGAPALPAR